MQKIGIMIGSLRENSFSGMVRENFKAMLKGKAEVIDLDISHLPLYNQDFDKEGASPKEYTVFRDTVRSLDAVIIVAPEHNRTMPAALKNALDIGSRPWGQNTWAGRKFMIVGSSPGKLSAFGAVNDVNKVVSFLGGRIMFQPEVYLGPVHELFDEKGVFVKGTYDFLNGVLDAFVKF